MFETLYLVSGPQTVIIVENVLSNETGSQHSAISTERKNAGDWSFNALTDRLMFGVMNPTPKSAVFDFFNKTSGIQENHFACLISPRTWVASTAEVDRGCYIEPAAVLSAYSRLGFGVSINRSASIGHHAEIGSYATIGPGAHIGGHTRIGKRTTIGIGATVFDHVEIGDGSIIGGGSVVTKDVPTGVVAYGNPCRVIRDNQGVSINYGARSNR